MLYMYEECLDVFNSMSYSEHALDAGRDNFNKNYTFLSERFEERKGHMQAQYGNYDINSEFSQKMEAFMNHLLFLYDSLSPQGRADIGYRSSFTFDETSSIYQKFYEMMKASPWRRMYDNDIWKLHIAQWKLDMTWMGKRLYCIAYYDNPQSRREYKRVQEDIADTNCQHLWDNYTAKVRYPPIASETPRDDPNDSPFAPHQNNPTFPTSRLTGLLRGLRTYA